MVYGYFKQSINDRLSAHCSVGSSERDVQGDAKLSPFEKTSPLRCEHILLILCFVKGMMRGRARVLRMHISR